MAQDREDIANRLRALPLESRGVVMAVLFGSVARGESGENSDVDVAFLLEEPFDPMVKLDLIADAQRALGTDAVDIVVMNGLTDEQPLLAVRILAEGMILLDRDPSARIDYHIRALGMADDARHLMRITDDAMRERPRG